MWVNGLRGEHLEKRTGTVLLIKKYRPKTIDEIVGHEHVKEWFKQYLDIEKVREMPHVSLEGVPGIGKTCFALAFFNDLMRIVGENAKTIMRSDYMELNASVDRGIDVVRKKIKEFARTVPLNKAKVKIVFLDEADSMTWDAYESLRWIMEEYTWTKFILSYNDPSKIHNAIRNRTVVFKLQPLKKDEVKIVLKRIVDGEGWEVEDEVLDRIAVMSGGSVRRAINDLQKIVVNGRVNKVLYEKIVVNPFYGIEDAVRESATPMQLFLKLSNGYTFDEVLSYVKAKIVEDDGFAKIVNGLGLSDYEMKDISFAKMVKALWIYKNNGWSSKK